MDAAGSVESWVASVTGGVFTLTASGSGLYLGGSFSAIGGQTRRNIASLNLMSGNIDAWNRGASQVLSLITNVVLPFILAELLPEI